MRGNAHLERHRCSTKPGDQFGQHGVRRNVHRVDTRDGGHDRDMFCDERTRRPAGHDQLFVTQSLIGDAHGPASDPELGRQITPRR